MKLKLPQGAFDAYLFDCDGTIVDSMPLHFVAWKKALGEWNCEFSEKLFYAWGGRPTPEIISTLNQMQGLSMPVERVAHRKEEFYFAMLPELKAVPEVLEHIDAQHGRIPFAVVSGSVRDSVTASSRDVEAARSIRDAGLRRRIPKEQARSRSISARGFETWSAAREAVSCLKIPQWGFRRRRRLGWLQ